MKDRTDWDRVKNFTDEEIDVQIRSNPDAAPDLDESWLAEAEAVKGYVRANKKTGGRK